MAYFFEIIQIYLAEHSRDYVDAQGFLAVVNFILTQLCLHLFKQRDVCMLLSVVTLFTELLDLRLVELSLHYE